MPSKYVKNNAVILTANDHMHLVLQIKPDAPHVYFWKPKLQEHGVLDSAVCCNWWIEPVTYQGIKFRSAEHAMMWAKANLFDDHLAMKAVLETRDPWSVKAIGRQVMAFIDKEWDDNSYKFVRAICYAKFSQSTRLKEWMLSQHPDTLFVEASPLDHIWGVKLDERHPDVMNFKTWRGYNLLGYALTEAMRKIRKEENDKGNV